MSDEGPRRINVSSINARRALKEERDRGQEQSRRWRPGAHTDAPVIFRNHPSSEDFVPDDGTHQLSSHEEPAPPSDSNIFDLVDDGYDPNEVVTCTQYADEGSEQVRFNLSTHTTRFIQVTVAKGWLPGADTPADVYRHLIHHGSREIAERMEFDPRMAARRRNFIEKQTLRAKIEMDRAAGKGDSELVEMIDERIATYLNAGNHAEARIWLGEAERVRTRLSNDGARASLDYMIDEYAGRLR